MYSLVHTRGVEQIKSEALELPLVYGNFWVCSSELVALVLRGVADGNVGAYGAGGGKNDIEPLDVGIISMTAVTSSIPMADAYLNPTTPVWLLHGTDHFTVLFADKEIAERSEEDREIVLQQWNGLPPAGPRMATVRLSLPANSEAAGPAPEKHAPTYAKPLAGEIEHVIQAHQQDKAARPGATWRWRPRSRCGVRPGRAGPRRPVALPRVLRDALQDVLLRAERGGAPWCASTVTSRRLSAAGRFG